MDSDRGKPRFNDLCASPYLRPAYRIQVVLPTCATVIPLLLAIYPGMREPGQVLAFRFCAFVDTLSVILVEQFWSLTNSVYTSDQGKCWYGLIATGRLLGGVAGGALSSFWIKQTGLRYSERRRTVQPQLPKATWMLETQPLRMQHQSGRDALGVFVRIQLVTENGMPRFGQMDAQLVTAPGGRTQLDPRESPIVRAFDDTVSGLCRLACSKIDPLPRTPWPIRRQGQIDLSFGWIRHAPDTSNVLLCHPACLEQESKVALGV